MKTIHVAEMIAEGGRDGRVEAAEGGFSTSLSTAERPDSVTPEHLFGGAYGACFLGALQNAAEKSDVVIEGATVTIRTQLEEEEDGGYQTCLYSKALRGEIDVRVALDEP